MSLQGVRVPQNSLITIFDFVRPEVFLNVLGTFRIDLNLKSNLGFLHCAYCDKEIEYLLIQYPIIVYVGNLRKRFTCSMPYVCIIHTNILISNILNMLLHIDISMREYSNSIVRIYLFSEHAIFDFFKFRLFTIRFINIFRIRFRKFVL